MALRRETVFYPHHAALIERIRPGYQGEERHTCPEGSQALTMSSA